MGFNIENINLIEISDDLKVKLLDNFSSLPKELRAFIQINNEDSMIDMLPMRNVTIDRNSRLSTIFQGDNRVKVINEPSFSTFESGICSIISTLKNRVVSQKYKDMITVLLEAECYDIESFINFEKLSYNCVIRLSNHNYKSPLIHCINHIITMNKIKAMIEIQQVFDELHRHKDDYIKITAIDDRLLSLHAEINGLTNKNELTVDDLEPLSILLYLYKNVYVEKEIPIGKYLYEIDLLHDESNQYSKIIDDKISNMKSENLTFNEALTKLVSIRPSSLYIPTCDKIEKSPNPNMICESVGNMLVFGDKSDNFIATDSILNAIRDITSEYISDKIGEDVTFNISEDNLTSIFGMDINIVTILIHTIDDDIESRHVVLYENNPYVLYTKKSSPNRIYGISKHNDKCDVITIKDSFNDYKFIYEI